MTRVWNWTAQTAADIRYAVRGWRRHPVVAVVVVGTLALGIGANTAVFSVVSPLVLRPLPFPDAGRLVWVARNPEGGASSQTYRVDVLEEFQREIGAFDRLSGYFAFFDYEGYVLGDGPGAERVGGVDVAPGFFELLGVRSALGRVPFADEASIAGPETALISDGLWARRFGRDPSVVGRVVTLNGRPVTITGVLPATFDFGAVFAPGTVMDVFVPMSLERRRPQGNTLALIGRLAPGATIGGAQAELEALLSRLPEEQAGRARAFVSGLGEHVTGPVRQPLFVLWGAGVFVLLIVIANLSSLLLARTRDRGHEVALRMVLGAGRRRVLCQLLTESVALAAAGAVVGVALAVGLTDAIRASAGLRLPLISSMQVDVAALVFTAVLTVVTGVAVGLVPAVRVSGRDPQAGLAEQSRGGTAARWRARSRGVLVVAEIALACMLLVGAALLLRSFVRLLDVELGFTPSNAVAVSVDAAGPLDPGERTVLLDELTRRVADLPGVEAAGLTDALPLGRNREWGVEALGQLTRDPDSAFAYVIGPGYFEAMGVPVTAGRGLSDLDRNDAEPVVAVSETLARRYWAERGATGRTLGVNGEPHRVVGVVADVRQTALDGPSANQVYLPYWQTGPAPSIDLIVRAATSPEALAPLVRESVGSLGGALVVSDVRPVGALVDAAVGPRRFLVTLLAGFALLALALACLGVYGVVSDGVHARTREIGIRMALGADRPAVLRGLLAGGAVLAGAGSLMGAAGAVVVTRYLEALLFEVDPLDPVTLLGVPVVLAGIATVAAYLPARRATRIDPLIALRAD